MDQRQTISAIALPSPALLICRTAFRLAPIVTLASGVPMDILLPGGGQRIPQLQRNAGGRLFHTGAELNAFITQINAAGGFGGQPLPLVSDNARFNDNFSSFDLACLESLQDRRAREDRADGGSLQSLQRHQRAGLFEVELFRILECAGARQQRLQPPRLSALIEFWSAGYDGGRSVWFRWSTRVSICSTSHVLTPQTIAVRVDSEILCATFVSSVPLW